MNIGVGEALLIALCGFVTVFLLLIFMIVVIKIISAVVRTLPAISARITRMFHKRGAKSAAPADQAPAAPAKEEEKPSKPWDGKLQLIDVDEETAACIMAIISDETDIPLDELQFRRIQAL